MKILWCISDLQHDGESLSSTIASVRLRCLIPAQALETLDEEIEIFLIHLSEPLDLDESVLAACDLVIVGKVFADWTPLFEKLKQAGKPMLIDLCDDVIAQPHLMPHYRKLFAYQSGLVFASDALSQRYDNDTGTPSFVIPDAVEGDRLRPRFDWDQRRALRLLWFGQPANLPALASALPALDESVDQGSELQVVTRFDPEVIEWAHSLEGRFKRLDIEFQPWSEQQMVKALDECDVVIVPSADDGKLAVKTENRVVTALWAGRACVAYPVPSYTKLGAHIVLDEDIANGLRKLLAQPKMNIEQQIADGQDYIAREFCPEAIAERWLDAISSYRTPSQLRNCTAEAVRLNLGCGDKILDGYVNVDLASRLVEKQPDVVCDVRDLKSIPNDCADEILSVHLIEHFYHWEAEQLLEEWMRVLKPGGKMILETPNILSACEQLLNNPEQSTGPGLEGQRTMWCFYGDPAHRDPLMCHKWLYSPQSLGQLMAQSGLKDIRQEPAEFKLREPRDMRMVGIKA